MKAKTIVKLLPKHPKLGRHVEHDPRSLSFAIGVLPKAAIQSQSWSRQVPVFDQGNLGSCTGNAGAGWVATDNINRKGLTAYQDKDVNEDFAVSLYETATDLDDIKGHYPPTDTGSSGLGVAKALQQDNLCEAYTHAFSIDALYAALQTGPAMLGTVWYNSMFDPAKDGRIIVTPNSGIAGGHEYLAHAIEVGSDGTVAKIWMTNSWGTSWAKAGMAYFTPEDLTTLLADQGDVTVPVVTAAPGPNPTPSTTMDITITDSFVIEHVTKMAGRKQETPSEYVENRLHKYFNTNS